MTRFAVTCFLCLAACGPSGAQPSEFSVRARWTPERSELNLELERLDEHCSLGTEPSLYDLGADARATANAVPMVLGQHGADALRKFCNQPTFELSSPALVTSVNENGGRVELEIAANRGRSTWAFEGLLDPGHFVPFELTDLTLPAWDEWHPMRMQWTGAAQPEQFGATCDACPAGTPTLFVELKWRGMQVELRPRLLPSLDYPALGSLPAGRYQIGVQAKSILPASSGQGTLEMWARQVVVFSVSP